MRPTTHAHGYARPTGQNRASGQCKHTCDVYPHPTIPLKPSPMLFNRPKEGRFNINPTPTPKTTYVRQKGIGKERG